MKKLAPISVEDFEHIAPRLGPCELVNGEIVPVSPAHMPHSRVTMNIAFLLEAFARKSRLGRAYTNEAGIVVNRDAATVRGADAFFISYKRLPMGEEAHGFLGRPPELVVEVFGAEESWADIEQKVAEYHGIGVDMVWVAEPKMLSLRLYPRKGEPYVLQAKDEIAGGKLLPGFRCKVSEFFAGI